MFEKTRSWFHRHRKGILITVTIVAITGTVAVLLIHGKKVKIPIKALSKRIVPETSDAVKATEAVANAAKKAAPEIAKATETVTVEVDGVLKTYPRSEFVRQLHEGWHPSNAKLAQAAERGIDLKPGETIVNACTVKMRV